MKYNESSFLPTLLSSRKPTLELVKKMFSLHFKWVKDPQETYLNCLFCISWVQVSQEWGQIFCLFFKNNSKVRRWLLLLGKKELQQRRAAFVIKDRAGIKYSKWTVCKSQGMELLIVLPGILLSPSSGGLTRGSFGRPLPTPATPASIPECMKQQKPVKAKVKSNQTAWEEISFVGKCRCRT